MSFVRNNIRYRSAASKAMEGYYNSKAFILNELIKSENGLSETAKEVCLLLFNKHSDWLAYSEHLMLNKVSIGTEEIGSMRFALDSIAVAIHRTFDENPDIFQPEFIKHWSYIHKQSLITLKARLDDAENMAQLIAFPYATECLVAHLNTTLFELYELDCLLGSDIVSKKLSTNDTQPNTLILFIEDGSLSSRPCRSIDPELNRYNYYAEHLIAPEKKFAVEIRDYSTGAENTDTRDYACEELSAHLNNLDQVNGVNVICPRA